MKYFMVLFLVFVCVVNSSFAQTGMKSRDIVSGSSNTSSAYSEINARTSRDADMNKINNDLNFYRSTKNRDYNQKVMDLEREKSKMINKK